MSEENVDLTYKALDAFNRRDLEAYLALIDPEVAFTPYEVAVQDGIPYRGHCGVRRWWEETFAVLPNIAAEVDEVRNLGDLTVVCGRLRRRGTSSGASCQRALYQAVACGH